MPLIGIVDPSHSERTKDKPGRLPNWLTLDEALMHGQAPNPKWSPWTFELMQAALGEQQERGAHISTTALTGSCPRSSILERTVDYISSLDDMYAALRGTMVHRTLEMYARQGAIAEARFYTTVDGIELSCSPDLLTTDTLFDYKVPTDISGVPSFGYPFRHQTEQLMTNAFIVRHAQRWDLPPGMKTLPFDPRDHHARAVCIVYLGPKTPKVVQYEKMEKFLTGAGVWKEAKRPYVWSDAEALEFIRPRLHLFQRALESYPEWPEPWVDPDTDMVYAAEEVWGGKKGWKCVGPPVCKLPSCLARRDEDMYAWPKQTKKVAKTK